MVLITGQISFQLGVVAPECSVYLLSGKRSYTLEISLMRSAKLNDSSIVARAAFAKLEHTDSSFASIFIASAKPAVSPGSTRRPLVPSPTSDGIPAIRVAITGSPQAIASSRVFGRPSRKLQRTNRSRPCMNPITSDIWPTSRISPLRSSLAMSFSSSGRLGPSPATSKVMG